jgi:hypothetical protein
MGKSSCSQDPTQDTKILFNFNIWVGYGLSLDHTGQTELYKPQQEGFTYATSLDLNMGYYTIRLDPTAFEMCTIIFPWGKYSYRRLPMGFGGSANIFQAQIMDLMASLKFVRAYIDNLLIITRGILDEHLQIMKTVLTRLHDAGLKVNAAKSLFCAHDLNTLVIY